MAFRTHEQTKKYAREWIAKKRQDDSFRKEHNKKHAAYMRKRRKEVGNTDYLHIRNNPELWGRWKKRIIEWQKKNKHKLYAKRKEQRDEMHKNYISRLLKMAGIPPNGINPQIIEATKSLLTLKREIYDKRKS